MQPLLRVAAIAALALGTAALNAPAQSVTFNFEDGTDQGFGHKFADDASETFPIDNIGGSNRMRVLRNGDFQEAEHATSNPASPFYQAMLAASVDETLYEISYDWYIDTSNYGSAAGTFMQLGTYVNSGSGYYAQDFPGTNKDVELDSTQLTSGQVFSGTVNETFAAKGFNLPTGETFFRFGFIINGDGAAQTVHYDNVIIRPVPEPAALALFGLGLPVLALRRRRGA
jgi:hypothetical protein